MSEPTLTCPRDGNTLQAMQAEGATGHYCSTCGGWWFQRTDFQNLKESPEAVEKESDGTLGSPPEPKEKPGPCPYGGHTTMKFRVIQDVQVDVCEEHEGIWFDPYEVGHIMAKADKSSSAGSAAAELGATALEIGGFVAKALLTPRRRRYGGYRYNDGPGLLGGLLGGGK